MISKSLTLSLLLSDSQSLVNGKDGISFVVVGDYANIRDMQRPDAVFDAISQMKAGAEKDSVEDFEFFVTTGDNLYALDAQKPRDWEFEWMMSLFNTRNSIKDLPIYPVRGNHEGYFDDQEIMVNQSQKYDTWKMPGNYYEKQFEIGPNGEKFALLQVDSPYLLCETVGKNKEKYFHMLDDHTKMIFESRCEGDQTFVQRGNEQMEWIKKTMAEQSQDDKIIWKASSMHHPMFGMHYDDYNSIIDDFLPLMVENNYDVFFNGHEHLQNYAYHPLNATDGGEGSNVVLEDDRDGTDCNSNKEWFPEGGDVQQSRKVDAFQGDFVHQMTIGASGKHTYDLCQSQYEKTGGRFKYAENFINGFALVHITTEEFTVEYKGVVNWNPTPDPFFKKFFMDQIGMNKLLPDQVNQEIYSDDKHLENGKKEIKHLLTVSIKKPSVKQVEPQEIFLSPMGEMTLLAGLWQYSILPNG